MLHKHPDKAQAFPLSFGQAHVFYPEANAARCTAALLLEVDPIGLVRGTGRALEQYVNDRPYVASSFLSVAIAQVFGTALSGVSKDRPELAQQPLPLEARLSVLPCSGGEGFLRRLFEPLGYTVTVQAHALDERFPDWGPSPYFTVWLQGHCRLKDLLAHLYVLVPVLDNDKHYWIGADEVEKLLRHGEGWLAQHPERDQITKRYLLRRGSLIREALARLSDEEGPDPDSSGEDRSREEAAIEEKIRLHDLRIGAVIAVLKSHQAKRVLDLGCGGGQLLRVLLAEPSFEQILGMDVSHRALEIAQERLHLDGLPALKRRRIELIHGSLTYCDQRLHGFDAAAVVEVVEHLDPARLAAFERVLFENARPRVVVLTTPNVEYNVRFEGLPAGSFRHKDHRFEWTRQEFQTWGRAVAERFGYSARFLPVGPEDPELGPPTQMGVFSL